MAALTNGGRITNVSAPLKQFNQSTRGYGAVVSYKAGLTSFSFVLGKAFVGTFSPGVQLSVNAKRLENVSGGTKTAPVFYWR